jgi:hypothetical protein
VGKWLLRWSCGCGRIGLLEESFSDPGAQLIFMCPACRSPVFNATSPTEAGGQPEVTVVRWDASVETIDLDRIARGSGIDLPPKPPPRGRGPAPAG